MAAIVRGGVLVVNTHLDGTKQQRRMPICAALLLVASVLTRKPAEVKSDHENGKQGDGQNNAHC